MAKVDSMMFSINVKLKNKHTSLKRRQISKTIRSGGYRVITSNVQWKKNLKRGNIHFLNVMNRSANVEAHSIISIAFCLR